MSVYNKEDTVVIAIGGATGSGKTSLTKKLKEKFTCARIFNMDKYFYDEDSPQHTMMKEYDYKHANWEIPSALDVERLVADLKSVLNDESACKGNKPNPIIIEGFLVHAFRELDCFVDKRFFLTLDKDECWLRRQLRNYTPPNLNHPEGYFDLAVWPGYENHLTSLKDQTDIEFLSGKNQDTVFTTVFKEVNNLVTASKTD